MQIHQLVLGELDTNCYVVSDASQKTLVIDPADDAEQILAFVKSQGLKVAAVVLTHAHFDHMLAAQAVCDATNAVLYVGQGDVDAMTDPIRNLSGLFTPGQEITLTDFQCLCEGDELTIGDVSFAVLETPGHTPGCICLYSDGILFAGDTLFRDSIGRLDFPGGDVATMMSSLQRLIKFPSDTQVFSGHGPDTTIGREIAHNPYLR